MGTRSLTVFEDGNGQEICVMYRQFDGYPDGHGLELADFLKGKKMVNGFGSDDDQAFNGMGCLVAQVIAHFKKGIGGFYIYPPGTRDAGEDYIYIVRGETGSEPTIKVEDFNDGASKYQAWLDKSL